MTQIPRPRRSACAALVVLALVLSVPAARASVEFFTDEAAWTLAVQAAAVEAFAITPATLVLADEVAAGPVGGQALGEQLTFRAPNTGLCGGFVVHGLGPSPGLTYLGGAAAGLLSMGSGGLRTTFPTGSFHAAGLFSFGDDPHPDQRLVVLGRQGVLGRLTGAEIPAATGGLAFVGVIASEPISSIRFEEAPGDDDTAVFGLRLGCGSADADDDGLSNATERLIGTDAGDPDSDGDGLPDGQEMNGTFGAKRLVSDGSQYGPSVADIDGDGDADVLLRSEGNDTVLWHENLDGAGSFGPARLISSSHNGLVAALAADLDGDGDPDALAASQLDDKIAWYENTDGAGNFGPEQIMANPLDPYSLIAADLDGDGDLDVSVALRPSPTTVSWHQAWYENTDGAGHFGPAQIRATAGSVGSAVDMDGDGDLDLLGTREASGIGWIENVDGAGTFGSHRLISSDADLSSSMRAADLDRDGDYDVLVQLSGADKETLVWYENDDGFGSFGARRDVCTGMYVTTWSVGDVDGDGADDALLGSLDPIESVWCENRHESESRWLWRHIPDGGPELLAADLDGDGLRDLLTSDGDVEWAKQIPWIDPLDPDTDDDGVPDGEELPLGLRPDDPDRDDDGALDGDELAAGTDPLDADSDDDGLLDGFELAYGFDPLAPGEESADPDGDGLDNLAEQAAGTDPNNRDTDGDGLSDGYELANGTDPLAPQVPALGPAGTALLGLVLALAGIVSCRRTPGARGPGPGGALGA